MKKDVILQDDKGNAVFPVTSVQNIVGLQGALSYLDADEAEVVNLEVSSAYLPYFQPA
jgi:hypothetical protein